NELDFWLSDEAQSRAPDALKIQFTWAREALAPYAGRVEAFQRGEIIPGIESVPLFGHTPGHSGFSVDGGGTRQLMIWGDCAHAVALQSRDPNISVILDLDPDSARRARHYIFDRVSADGVMVTGMHVTFPGFGHLHKSESGFEYVPH